MSTEQAAEQATEVPTDRGGLFTSSFWGVPRGMAAVRVSLGVPGGLRQPLVEWPAVYPWGLLEATDRAEFEARYRARLTERKARILRELEVLRSNRKPLCLVCWEDLHREGSWCHRRILAEVLGGWLGEQIPEVTVPARQDRPKQVVEVALGRKGRPYAYGWDGERLHVGERVLLPANRASREPFEAMVVAETSDWQGPVVMILARLEEVPEPGCG